MKWHHLLVMCSVKNVMHHFRFLAPSSLKVNINAFLCLFLKLSPSNLLFSRFKVIAGRKVTPADFLWIWVSAAAESSSLTTAIQSQALVLHFTSSWMEKGKAGFLLHRWTCLCLHAVCRLAVRYQHINICHFWYRWTVTWKVSLPVTTCKF